MAFGQYSRNFNDPSRQVANTGIIGRARVKRVFDTAQCAHVWAAQSQDEGRSHNGNIYFRGSTIYSYRDSFPLASFIAFDVVLINSDKYSVTTSAHLSDVRSSLRGKHLLVLSTTLENVRAYMNAHDDASRKAVASRIVTAWLDEKGEALSLNMKWSKVSTIADLRDSDRGYALDGFGTELTELATFAERHKIRTKFGDPLSLAQTLVDQHAARKATKLAKVKADREDFARRELDGLSNPEYRPIIAALVARIGEMQRDAVAVQYESFDVIRTATIRNCFPSSRDVNPKAWDFSLYDWHSFVKRARKCIAHARGENLKAKRDSLRVNIKSATDMLAAWDRIQADIQAADKLASSVRFLQSIAPDATSGDLAARAVYAEKKLGHGSLAHAIETAQKFGLIDYVRNLTETLSAVRGRQEVTPYISKPAWQYERSRNARRMSHEESRAAWLDGQHVSFRQESSTLVRRMGSELQTSRGAEAPWQSAKAIFAKARDCLHKSRAWHRNGETMRAGPFELETIDAGGNIKIGCHTIAFDEMQRLALRECPELVKARYPVPAVI